MCIRERCIRGREIVCIRERYVLEMEIMCIRERCIRDGDNVYKREIACINMKESV